MPISEIRCYHNGCPKRKFFNSLPIDHIFIYATLGPTDIMYDATGYCIFKEDYTATTASDIEEKFCNITTEASPIRIFLGGEEKPKYYKSLNALAFKYKIEFKYEAEIQNEEKKIVSSFYIALREKCRFEDKNIAEIKVLKKDRERTEEAVFLRSLDVETIKRGIKQLESIEVKFIEKTTKQLKSIDVYERIRWKDVTQEYNKEKIPINKLQEINRLDLSTISQNQKEQVRDLLHFFDVFLPVTYSKSLPETFKRIKPKDPIEVIEALKEQAKIIEEKLKRVKPKDPIEVLEEQAKIIEEKLKRVKPKDLIEVLEEQAKIIEEKLFESARRIKYTGKEEKYMDLLADIKTFHFFFRIRLKEFRSDKDNIHKESALKSALKNFERTLIEAELLLEEREDRI